MTITVVMKQSIGGEDGTPWLRGNSYEASQAFADYLLRADLASYGSAMRAARVVDGRIDLPTARGAGVTVEDTYSWRDIIGSVHPKVLGVGSPTRAAYDGGNVGQFAWIANDVCDFEYHIPHDYASDPSTDIFFHVHWSHTGTSISGNAVFDCYYQYAKGHNQAEFSAEKNVTITYATTDIATTPAKRHRIDEVIISGPSATASLMDRDDIEVDGLVIATLKLTTLPTIGGGGKLFVHTCDVHYQSTNVGTLRKAPSFYV